MVWLGKYFRNVFSFSILLLSKSYVKSMFSNINALAVAFV